MYAAASSRITDQHTTNGATDIQHFGYTYDDAGNMTSRSDVRLGLSESFTFDDLDRLTGGQVNSQTAATYAFDVVGNITEKSDAGNPFLYTSSAVHAVTGITVGASTQNLSYDPNGNLSTGDDVPTITWSSYNKPTQLTKGAVTYTFSYGPDRTRYKKTHSNGNTTYYIGSGFEQINKPSATEYRHVIRANGRAILLRKDFTAGTATHQYLHRDHLGSVTALTRETDGTVIERYSYDAWGARRNPTTWAAATITAYEQRGYTGHEHLDDIGIIHMNGRIYDPKLGRMLSPDPVTQAPENGQNYNRYSYAYNNPLRYTDPSGFQSKDCANTSGGRMCFDQELGYYVPSGGAPSYSATVSPVFSFGFGGGGNKCDSTCQTRRAAHEWCKTQAVCFDAIHQVREGVRKKAALAIQQAEEAGYTWFLNNERVIANIPVVGGLQPGDKSFVMAVGEWVRGNEVRALIASFDSTIATAGYFFGVDVKIIKAIIYEEQTHLDPVEEEREQSGFGNTIGLGQITIGLYDGLTRERLLDPVVNIATIARHLAVLQTQNLLDPGQSIASLATSYNRGMATSITPYGRRVADYYNGF